MKEIIRQFEQALLAMDQLEARRIFNQLNAELDMQDCVDRLIVPTLEHIGLQWEQGELALAQVYMSGRICEALVDIFLPSASPQRIDTPRTAIVVLEDFHSLGKSIIFSVLRASGIEVRDLGTLSVSDLVSQVIKDDIKILLISTLMFSSAKRIKDVSLSLKARGSSVRIIVGGAPFRFDRELWQAVGADAVGINTAEAIEITHQAIRELS